MGGGGSEVAREVAPPASAPGVREGRSVNATRLSSVALLVRLALGALFVFSAWSKLRDPQMLAFAIKSTKLGLSDWWVVRTAFMVSWLEGICGACLLIGIPVRAAASILAALMIVFAGIILSLGARGLDVHCPCFGAFQLFCDGPMGACHVVRNLLLALLCGVVIVARRRAVKADPRNER